MKISSLSFLISLLFLSSAHSGQWATASGHDWEYAYKSKEFPKLQAKFPENPNFLEAATPKVRCEVSFRKSPYVGPVEPFKTLEITAEKNGIWHEILLGDFRFQLAYDQNLNDGHFIKIYVWPAEIKNTMPYDALAETWYTLPETVGNINFSHFGFTGLQYAYHKVTKSELQYACERLQ